MSIALKKGSSANLIFFCKFLSIYLSTQLFGAGIKVENRLQKKALEVKTKEPLFLVKASNMASTNSLLIGSTNKKFWQKLH